MCRVFTKPSRIQLFITFYWRTLYKFSKASWNNFWTTQGTETWAIFVLAPNLIHMNKFSRSKTSTFHNGDSITKNDQNEVAPGFLIPFKQLLALSLNTSHTFKVSFWSVHSPRNNPKASQSKQNIFYNIFLKILKYFTKCRVELYTL